MSQAWWRDAVGYQISLSSFADGNHDGLGDLLGVYNRLSYLKTLGINLLWIGPFYPSPMNDNGYDVRDFKDVDPRFGTLSDFSKLLAKAHELGIRVIIDLVLNHTSDTHPWFQASRKDPHSAYKDFYIWRDEVNNWRSFFGRSVWNFDAQRKQYYLALFDPSMPDLNWHHPAVRQAMVDVAKFWLDLGVDGFRVDAVSHLAKDLSFQDAQGEADVWQRVLDPTRFSNREPLFGYLTEFRQALKDYPEALFIGEVGGNASVELARRFTDPKTGLFHMVFTFDHCWVNHSYGNDTRVSQRFSTDVRELRMVLDRWMRAYPKGQPALYWLNHDHPRLVNQYGSPYRWPIRSAKMLALVMYLLGGTPFIYNGEEIGMMNADDTTLSDYTDTADLGYLSTALTRLSKDQALRYLRRASRFNARTAMQWTHDSDVGFTDGVSQIYIQQNHRQINVADQLKDPDSVLSFYRCLLTLRKTLGDAVVNGALEWLDDDDPDVLCYRKKGQTHDYVVLANFRGIKKSLTLNELTLRPLLGNIPAPIVHNDQWLLRPFEAWVMEVV